MLDRVRRDPATDGARRRHGRRQRGLLRPARRWSTSADPTHEIFTTEYFGPVLGVLVYDDADWSGDARPGGRRRAVRADRRGLRHRPGARSARPDRALRFSAGNFYVNDKPTGAVVGQQPFGGARASGTNDKAGSLLNLLRWVSPRTIKETFVPADRPPLPPPGMSAPRTGDERQFGEEGARLSYGSYLRLSELLDQQVPASGGHPEEPGAGVSGGDGRPDPQPAHDELLFITIHQVYELWFQQLLHELGDARDRDAGGRGVRAAAAAAAGPLDRAGAGRAGRRAGDDDPAGLPGLPVGAGAGERVPVGAVPRDRVPVRAKDEAYLRRLAHANERERERLVRRLAEPTLWDGFVLLLGEGRLRRGDRGVAPRGPCSR